MDNMSLIKKLPSMLSGSELEQALTILPEYDPGIINENAAVRLIALSDMYKVFVPTQMSKEIYAKMYLSLLRSLQKKESKLAVRNTQKITKVFGSKNIVALSAVLILSQSLGHRALENHRPLPVLFSY